MKLREMRVSKQPKLMIIPMIDIIFFLLVFFMMSMLTMVVQKSVDLSLPKTQSAKVSMETTVPISIKKDGAIYFEQEPIHAEDLRRRIEVEKNRNPQLAILVRADAESQYNNFMYVLDQVKLSGISRIGIATDGAKPAPVASEP
ncbi:MAG: biopolymer transporter ExbD [Negativicoccus massiliensis]|uniref:ExbD/TolR family protein n=1 Tax=Negativicoccus succinicivorans TaxID=620903 RepID=UPI0029142101|nr:biopolymer transporter ExbD [Negativicoccus succinicivorans]MDU4641920.1 biopolymer transporter ExbD [Negativicoccus massiliensis]MDU5915893.1 biopolymer transporter ExbD [Negativicoccus succinicivorans]